MRRRWREKDSVDLPIHRWADEQAREDTDERDSDNWTRELLKRREDREAEQGEREEELPIELRRLLHNRKPG
jgi:hypothetical protein